MRAKTMCERMSCRRRLAVVACALALTGGVSQLGSRAPAPISVGTAATHVVRDGESLVAIAARDGVESKPSRRTIISASARVTPGSNLSVDNPHLVARVEGAD